MSDALQQPVPGFYGKLPAYGDFIQKRLPRSFTAPWDDWLQTGIAAAKSRLPQSWLSYYLNCPAWRFVLADGVCGDQACAGVTIPSVDRVGRYFNFTVAALLPPGSTPTGFLMHNRDWFAEVEELALSALGDELDQDAIDEAIERLPMLRLESAGGRLPVDMGTDALCLSGDPMRDGGTDALGQLLHHLLESRSGEAYGLWLESGSTQVAPQLLCCADMPNLEQFLGMMMSEDAVDAESTGEDGPEAAIASPFNEDGPVSDLPESAGYGTGDINDNSLEEGDGDVLLDKFLAD